MPLQRDEIISVIETGAIPRRVPMVFHFWVHPETFGDKAQAVRDILGRYPMDAQIIRLNPPEVFEAPVDEPGYRWMSGNCPKAENAVGIDAQIAIKDWKQLKDVLENFPDPYSSKLIPDNQAPDGRYRIGHWWYCLFERHWSLRGMENALMDFYTNPNEVKELYRKLTDFYLVVIARSKEQLDADAILTSDDLGGQTGPMFSPEIFREFFMPFYREMIEKAHSLGMHFWLHSCGNIEKFIPGLIDVGLDVLHPIQKYTMDEKAIAEKYAGQICFWAGVDVQQVIPWGSTEDVRAELRNLIDIYSKAGAGVILAAGNAINGDCPTENLKAMFQEALEYGGYVAK